MTTQSERRRNNVRAGVFVTATIILTVVVIVILSGAWGTLVQRTDAYAVRYPVSAGVRDIQAGAQVRVGGVVMGRVAGVRPHLVAGAPFESIDVDFEIDRAVTLYGDAKIFIGSPLLGSDAWLDIPSVGTAEAGPPADGLIQGAVSAGLLTTMLGPGNASSATEIIDNAKALSEDAREFGTFLGTLPGEYDERVVPILDNVQGASADVRTLAATIREDDWPRWSAKVDEVMTWATEFTGTLDEAVNEGRDLFRDGRTVIADNREGIDTIVDNVEVASGDVRVVTERVREETVDKVHRLLDRGHDAMDGAVATIERFRADFAGWGTAVDDILANATLASQQLKLATIEVRRSPWKLLYRPSDKELEHELLYDAARSFALATADLKAAAASTQIILEEHGEQLAADPALRERVQRGLLEPLDSYEEAQRRLLDILFVSE